MTPVWVFLTLGYVAIGLLLIAILPRVRREVLGSFSYVGLDRTPLWATCFFGTLFGAAILLLWPVFLPGWLKKKRSAMDELKDDPRFKECKLLVDAMKEMSADGCDTDEIPGGHGEFGHALTNPIPARTVFGSKTYLVGLRTADGEKVAYTRIGSFSSSVSDHPVDGYSITGADGKQLATLYLSPYHKRNSAKSPAGFTCV